MSIKLYVGKNDTNCKKYNFYIISGDAVVAFYAIQINNLDDIINEIENETILNPSIPCVFMKKASLEKRIFVKKISGKRKIIHFLRKEAINLYR